MQKNEDYKTRTLEQIIIDCIKLKIRTSNNNYIYNLSGSFYRDMVNYDYYDAQCPVFPETSFEPIAYYKAQLPEDYPVNELN